MPLIAGQDTETMNKKKNILYATGMHSAKYGGLEKFLVLVCRELTKYNVRLIILYNSLPRSNEFIKDIEETGSMIKVAHAMHPVKYFFSFFKIFIVYRPKIVHTSFQIYYSIIFAKMLFCRYTFISLNGMLSDRNINEVTKSEQLPRMTIRFRKIINRMTNHFFAISDAVRQQYIRLFPETAPRIETEYVGSLPNNYDRKESRLKLNVDRDKVIIGIICFFSPIKGMDILLDAMDILLHKMQCSDFIVYQIGIDPLDPNSEYLLETARRGSLSEHIYWAGIRDDVFELLPGMDIYCQPSRSEGLGFSLIEAGMAGLPLVGSNVGGIPESVRDGYNGFLFTKEDPEMLAAKLFKLIKDEELRSHFGENSKSLFLKEFNMQERAEKMSKTYLDYLDISY